MNESSPKNQHLRIEHIDESLSKLQSLPEGVREHGEIIARLKEQMKEIKEEYLNAKDDPEKLKKVEESYRQIEFALRQALMS